MLAWLSAIGGKRRNGRGGDEALRRITEPCTCLRKRHRINGASTAALGTLTPDQARQALREWADAVGTGRGHAIDAARTGKHHRPDEFFTPPDLAAALVAAVPPAAWTLPGAAVWEPAAGRGALVAAAMAAQLEVQPTHMSTATWMRHLVQCVWHINELDPTNAAFIRQRLAMFGRPNVHVGDTLAHTAYLPAARSCSVVIMNPPFSNTPKSDKGASRRQRGSASLWPRFVELALQRLRPDRGVLVAVHPSKWRIPGDSVGLAVQQSGLRLRHIRMHGKAAAKKAFGVAQPIDAYVAVAHPGTLTAIAWPDGHARPRHEHNYNDCIPPFLPTGSFALWQAMHDTPGARLCVQCSATHPKNSKHHSPTRSATHTHPIVFALSQRHGVRRVWSSRPHQWQLRPKVLISSSQRPVAVADCAGSVGVTPGAYCVLCPTATAQRGQQHVREWATAVCRWVNSPVVRCCNAAGRLSSFMSIAKVLALLPAPPACCWPGESAPLGINDPDAWADALQLGPEARSDMASWWEGLSTAARTPVDLCI